MTRDREFNFRALAAFLRQPVRFELGQVVATPNALSNVSREEMMRALGRHHLGDWGDLDDEDKQANERALQDEARLLSAYHTAKGRKFWIITEADRSSTCVLMPEDY